MNVAKITLLLISGCLARNVALAVEEGVSQLPEPASARADDRAANGAPTGLKYPGQKLRDAFEQAVAQHAAALKREPDSVEDLVGLADSYISLWCFGFVPHAEAYPKARTAVERATKLDDQFAAAHTTLGVLQTSQWEWRAAEAAFQRAIALDANQPKTHHWYALYLAALGRHDTARTHSERALQLDGSVGYQVGRGAVFYFARDFPQMTTLLRQTVERQPNVPFGYDWLGMALVGEKRFDEAIDVYRRALALSDGLAEIKAGLGHAYGVAGRRAEALRILHELQAADHEWYVPPVQIAYVCVSTGQNDLAITYLEQARREHSWELVFMRAEPWLDELRTDKRFQAIERELRFPPRE